MARLPQIPRRIVTTQAPRSTVSGEDIASPYRILGDAIGSVGQALETAYLPQAEAAGARSVTRGPDGEISVQQKPEFSRTQAAFNRGARVAYLAELGPQVRDKLGEIRRQNEGDLDAMQTAFQAYSDEIIANQRPELAPAVGQMLATETERYYRGAETDFYNRETARQLNAIKAEINLKSDEMARLAQQGGVDTEDYRQFQQEYYDLWQEALADPRFNLTAEEVELDVRRTEERHIEQAEAARDRLEREGDAAIEKEGVDLDREGLMTEEWLDAHRDDLSPSAYRRFSKSIGDLVAGPRVRTDPQEYVRLLDMAESDDPERRALAEEEARDAYLEEHITKTDFNRLMSRAAGDEERLQDAGIAQVRKFVGGTLRPPSGSSDQASGRFLDQMLRFDEWLQANPDASARDVQAYGETFVRAEKDLAILESTSPLPQFSGVRKPEDLTPADIERGRALLRRALDAGLIDPEAAADEALSFEGWERMIGGTNAAATR